MVSRSREKRGPRRLAATTTCLAAPLFIALAACSSPAKRLVVGGEAPRFELPALGGGVVSSESLIGKPMVLNFWATWCAPCVKEIPVLLEVDADPAAEVISIALDKQGESAVRPFVEENGIDYRVLLGNQRVFQRFDGFGIPYTLVLDEAYRVVNVYRGPVSAQELSADIERALGRRRG